MLRNWPIRSKLVVILIVPLAALAVLSAIQVRGDVDNVRAADRIEALANFSIKANDLVNALQGERYATNAFAGSNFSVPTLNQTVMDLRPPVDQALAVYRADEERLPQSARQELDGTLSVIGEHLDQLAEHRRQFDARQMQLAANVTFYDTAVKDLLVLNARVASGSTDARLVNGSTTLAGISQAKEQASQQRGSVAQMLFLAMQGVRVTPQAIWQLQATAGAEDAWIEQFGTTATAEQQEFFNTTVGRSQGNIDQVRDRIVEALANSQPITMSPLEWAGLADAKIEQMREVERRVASDLGATSSKISGDASRGALFGSIGVAAILIVSIVISLLVASPMISQLRRLRRGALDTATERLPAVVERLHRGEPVDLAAEAFPVPATSKDEIGQLADAFATVHEVAVRTAVEQAAMRKSIGDTFLNLARRSQALIHRQLKIIDALERKETDPDELEELFRLDHLATRMRRHAEDLIVLSGSKPARGWRRPVPIKDVVRGAVAEVEDYTRVKVMPITGGAVSGHAVGDVIHLFAELIENATSFSPPHTPVQVSGHPVSNGFVVEIEDRGLGMSQEEIDALNHRLANPPPFDLSTSERLGLFVVGRLSERHAVQVLLRSSPYGGTMAIVLLPDTLLRASDDKGEDTGPRELAAVGAGASSAGAQPGGVAALNGAGDHPEIAGMAGLDAAPSPNGRWHGDIAGGSAQGDAQGALGTAHPAGPRTDETLLDDLPVFATARSSWFVADRPRGGLPGDEDGPDGPREPGDLTSPMPMSELTDPDEEPGTEDEPGSAGADQGWQGGRYGRAEQEQVDGRYHAPGSPGSLFSAPPDTGQFSGFGPSGYASTGYDSTGYDEGAYRNGQGGAHGNGNGDGDGSGRSNGRGAGRYDAQDYLAPDSGASGFGAGGFGTDAGFGGDPDRFGSADGGFGTGSGFGAENGAGSSRLPGTGDGFGGVGFGQRFPADPREGGSGQSPLAGELPSRRRGGRTSGDGAGLGRSRGDRFGADPLGSDPLGSDPLGSDPLGSDPLGGDDPSGGYREPRADRGSGYAGRPPRDGGAREGGARPGGNGGYAGYSRPGYDDSPPQEDGGFGDGAYRQAPRTSRGTGGGPGLPGRSAPEQGQAGVPPQAGDPHSELDELGLPKRRRRANLAPQLRRENADSSRSAMTAGPRSPEEIRSMMSSFQANFGRGIEDGTVSNDGDDVGKVT
ncbi:sensor histidine kinase [Parafrankia elaeagni]|uniref:sensor histidine kinase n=1 Tax=Parafrankia elaeagni TaxID=222534 RepID=UPI00035F0D4C|nr:nitrate- and nitrite sensing domain-containing protein [Parafrankia elaeagni]